MPLWPAEGLLLFIFNEFKGQYPTKYETNVIDSIQEMLTKINLIVPSIAIAIWLLVVYM